MWSLHQSLAYRVTGRLSFFSSRRVLWVNFELVLATDDTVNASADGHENLLKGGFNNFGIITRFHMTTFEQGRLWGGDVHHGTDQFFPASAGVSGLHHRRGCVRLCAPPSQRCLCCHVRRGDGKELGVLHKTSGKERHERENILFPLVLVPRNLPQVLRLHRLSKEIVGFETKRI